MLALTHLRLSGPHAYEGFAACCGSQDWRTSRRSEHAVEHVFRLVWNSSGMVPPHSLQRRPSTSLLSATGTPGESTSGTITSAGKGSAGGRRAAVPIDDFGGVAAFLQQFGTLVRVSQWFESSVAARLTRSHLRLTEGGWQCLTLSQ